MGTPALSKVKKIPPASWMACVTQSRLLRLGVDPQKNHLAVVRGGLHLAIEIGKVEVVFVRLEVGPILANRETNHFRIGQHHGKDVAPGSLERKDAARDLCPGGNERQRDKERCRDLRVSSALVAALIRSGRFCVHFRQQGAD